MVELLPGAALQALDFGGQNSARGPSAQPSSDNLANCLALGLRGADLLLDLSREAVKVAKRGETIPPVIWWNSSYRDPLCNLFHRLAERKINRPGR